MAGRVRPVVVVLGVLVVLGIALRLPGLGDPPVRFHPTRQYHGLNGARATYLRWTPGSPAGERRVAQLTQDRDLQLEPPLLETVVAAGYKLLGGERIWLGRLLS